MRRRIIPKRARRAARRARTRFYRALTDVTRRAFIPKIIAAFYDEMPTLSAALAARGVPVVMWSQQSDPYSWGAEYDGDLAGADDARARAALNAREKAALVGRAAGPSASEAI